MAQKSVLKMLIRKIYFKDEQKDVGLLTTYTSHAHTHACTHARTHTRTHTHTHTHARKYD